ncbi:hypothetical protein DO70_4489 [Burkholderia pseudomallei]|nr:hypothetical protein DO70_4489 [Burkholderia pseudomallei]
MTRKRPVCTMVVDVSTADYSERSCIFIGVNATSAFIAIACTMVDR